VFVTVLQKPRSFAGHSKFSTWLCSIAKNKGADWMRKNKRMKSLGEDYSEAAARIVDFNADFVAKLEEGQDSEALRHCIDRLPKSQRDAIFWVYYEEESLETVAQKLTCPLGTVKSRLFHGRKSLQHCLSRWIEGGRYGN
jgi:RNA polymerase sigma factor (sigma-70 family)